MNFFVFNFCFLFIFLNFVYNYPYNEDEEEGVNEVIRIKKEPISYTTLELRKSIVKDDIVFVMFFVPNCATCEQIAPIWEEMTGAYHDNNAFGRKISIGNVDCSKENTACEEHGVKIHPSIMLFKNGGEIIDFEGDFEFEAFEDFLIHELNDLDDHSAHELNVDNFEKTISSGYVFVNFFTKWSPNCALLAPYWENLTIKFKHSNVRIAHIECASNQKLCDEIGIPYYPALYLYYNKGLIAEYNGNRSVEGFIDFLERNVYNLDLNFFEEEKRGEMIELTEQTHNNMLKFDGIVFVEYFVPWCSWCKILEPIWKELPSKFLAKDPVRIAKFDCTPSRSFCKSIKISIYPTLILYKRGKKIEEYNGLTDIKTLHKYLKLHYKYINSEEL